VKEPSGMYQKHGRWNKLRSQRQWL
jgi:hypothetical protein